MSHRFLPAAALITFALTAACADALTPEPRLVSPDAPGIVMQAYDCQADIATQSVSCADRAALPSGPARIIIGGSNGQFVRFTSSNRISTPDSMSFDVTLQNLIGQTMGTVDGVSAHPDGIRVLFESGPTEQPLDPSLPSSVTIGNPDGYGFFFTPQQPYFQYAGLLPDAQTSAPRRWRFDLQNVASFRFSVLVWTQVQYPQGWLAITPATPALAWGDADTLGATVRNAYGILQPDGITWMSSDPSVVTVAALTDTTAEITGVGAGTAWVRAVSTSVSARRDSVLVTVN